MAPEVRVGLALGGGFARGIAHIGVLQALVERGIPIHLVAGTSAGSLVGALFAAGIDPWHLERLTEAMNWRGLVRLKLRREGLLDASGLERFILGHVGDLSFSDLKLPFTATATDLLSGEEVLLQSGRVAPAVRASCAFPGIFLPVRMEQRLLVDGGLVHPVPAAVARRMGADLVLAVELSQTRGEQRPPRNLLHILLYSLSLVQRPQVAKALEEADVVIRPDVQRFSAIELERVGDLVRAGREATYLVLPEIRSALDRLQAEQEGLAAPVRT